MIYFTADTHFGHSNIIKYCNRPFSTVEEMDAVMIERFNSRVQPEDICYIIGDFAFRKPKDYLSKLNGKIYRIRGSHDPDIPEAPYMLVQNFILVDGTEIQITMNHHPMRSWPLSHYGHWHLFGHHHGTLEPYGLSFDVGVDTNNFYPYSLSDVIVKMDTLKPIIDFSKRKVPYADTL